jgi:hypothetical protein
MASMLFGAVFCRPARLTGHSPKLTETHRNSPKLMAPRRHLLDLFHQFPASSQGRRGCTWSQKCIITARFATPTETHRNSPKLTETHRNSPKLSPSTTLQIARLFKVAIFVCYFVCFCCFCFFVFFLFCLLLC